MAVVISCKSWIGTLEFAVDLGIYFFFFALEENTTVTRL